MNIFCEGQYGLAYKWHSVLHYIATTYVCCLYARSKRCCMEMGKNNKDSGCPRPILIFTFCARIPCVRHPYRLFGNIEQVKLGTPCRSLGVCAASGRCSDRGKKGPCEKDKLKSTAHLVPGNSSVTWFVSCQGFFRVKQSKRRDVIHSSSAADRLMDELARAISVFARR